MLAYGRNIMNKYENHALLGQNCKTGCKYPKKLWLESCAITAICIYNYHEHEVLNVNCMKITKTLRENLISNITALLVSSIYHVLI